MSVGMEQLGYQEKNVSFKHELSFTCKQKQITGTFQSCYKRVLAGVWHLLILVTNGLYIFSIMSYYDL